MNQYFHIPGYKDAPKGLPCIAFDKLDGQNVRFEWTKKRGWYKFGTRRRLFDESDVEFGRSIPVFLNKYGDAIPKVLRDEKEYRGITEVIVFCEWVGPNSFAGIHDPNDTLDVVLFDVNPYKKGIISPRQFIKHFGHLDIPRTIFVGNFNQEFINDVRKGRYDVKEGVVAKGNKPNGRPPHNYWCAKIKTLGWLAELKRKSEYIESLRLVLAENEKEQGN
jgi:hypothetical protein